MNKLIRLSKSNISKEEIKEVKQVLKLGFLEWPKSKGI